MIRNHAAQTRSNPFDSSAKVGSVGLTAAHQASTAQHSPLVPRMR